MISSKVSPSMPSVLQTENPSISNPNKSPPVPSSKGEQMIELVFCD